MTGHEVGLGRSGIGTTALGRLRLRVHKDGVAQDVLLERRWTDAASARAWCEREVARPSRGVEVQEAQVFTERWQHPRCWEEGTVRALPERVQDGWPDGAGGISWTAVQDVDPALDYH